MGILQFLFSMGIRIDDDLASFFFGIFTPLESPATYGGDIEKDVHSFLRADLKIHPF
jgi:hypothetical protein